MSVLATMLSAVFLVSETWSTLRDNQITCASRRCWNAVHTHCDCLLFARLKQKCQVIVRHSICLCDTVGILFWLLCDCDKSVKIIKLLSIIG